MFFDPHALSWESKSDSRPISYMIFFNKFHFPYSICVSESLAPENALSVDFKNVKWIIFPPGELLP